MFQIAAMALGSQIVLAAERLPEFDTAPSCRSAAAASVMIGRTTENYMQDEHNARDLLKKSWDQYSAADKSHCDSLERTGGPPSYVELLSCLEMSHDARATTKDGDLATPSARNGTPAGTTGAGTPMKELPVGAQPAAPRNR
jgi:hypothetical protein